MTDTDWNPDAYGAFADLRLQPALDLMQAAGDLPPGPIVDLGCGAGVMGAPFRLRHPGRTLVGIDTSPAMLDKARATGAYDALAADDAATWQPGTPPALIFSNAVLQWVPDHAQLLPRLVSMLAAGGVLAIQLPHQQQRPSGKAWREAFRALAGTLPDARQSEVLSIEQYFDLLNPLGELRLWETDYVQHLAASDRGHPVRLYTETTFGRPFLNALPAEDRPRLLAEYERRIDRAYPRRPDGSVLFPFRRMFMVLRAGRPGLG